MDDPAAALCRRHRRRGRRTSSGRLTLVTCDDAFLAQTKRAAMVCTLVGEVDTENADAASE